MARPELKVLRFVQRCNDKHIALVSKCAETMWDRPSPLEIVERRDASIYAFWEVGDASALIITTCQSLGIGNELYLVAVAGTGIIGKAGEVISDLRTIARELGCRLVGGMSVRDGWGDFALAHGFRKVATYYSLDLELQ